MTPLLTPYQELQAIYLGKFIGLARIAAAGEDPAYIAMRLQKLAAEYNLRDHELLNDLPRSG